MVGIAETLRMVELACPPEHVSDEPLVRTVIAGIEKHPEQLGEDFIVLASEVIMASWPCKDLNSYERCWHDGAFDAAILSPTSDFLRKI